MRGPLKTLAAAWLVVVAGTGCSSAAALPAGAPQPQQRPISEADVHFMAGMIPHHAQAIRMAELAKERTDSRHIQLLSERIIVSQRDEIAMLQQWLRGHGKPVPAADATHMEMEGHEHGMLMPGMLSEEELARLEQARGLEFERLLLRYMIRHHEGALIMVDELLDSYGGAQDDFVYKFASDVFADQTAEIERMRNMLAARGGD